MNTQGAFNFENRTTEQGYAQWIAGRKIAAEAIARKIGLPLGHQVEVWLIGEIRLRGLLRLREELLFIEEDRLRHLELIVDGVFFTYREMQSCVRLD